MPTQYAAIADLKRVGASADVLRYPDNTPIGDAELNGVLLTRSVFADGYFAARRATPLPTWGDDVRLCVAQLAAWDVLTTLVGMDLTSGSNGNWLLRRDEALRWLELVSAGKVILAGAEDATPEVDEGGPECLTEEPRGF